MKHPNYKKQLEELQQHCKYQTQVIENYENDLRLKIATIDFLESQRKDLLKTLSIIREAIKIT